MANIKSAKKRAVQSEKRRTRNLSLKSAYRTHIKKVEALIADNKKDEAVKELKAVIKTLDKIASKKIIHKNKAARHKTSLTKKVKKLG